jgi:colanic acid biosynthesis glycosyl transferase WcaI
VEVTDFFSDSGKILYHNVNHISLISDGFRQNLLAKDLSDDKLSIGRVWADSDVVYPLLKENNFRQKYGLQDNFVDLYAGNIGITSALEDVVAAANLLQDEHEIVFLLVGEGIRKNALIRQAHELGRVIFLSFQPRSSVAEMSAAADVCLVTLNAESSPYSLPSEIFDIMAAGRALLAVTPVISEVAQLLESAQCGYNVPPGNPNELANKILELIHMPAQLETWGKNAREYLLAHFSRKICLDLYESMLSGVAA